MSSDALSKSLSLTAARGCVRISMDEGAKARAHFVSRKGSSSFVANVVSDEERKAAIEAINSNRKTRKSLTAEEVTAIDPMTGTEGKWVRPNITFDPAPVHVPPPPPGLVPTFGLPPGGGKVPMPILDEKAGGRRTIMARASSGKFPAAMREPARVASRGGSLVDGMAELSASAGQKRASRKSVKVNAVGEVRVTDDVAEAMKARAHMISKKSSSFIVETRSDEERQAALDAFKKSSFRKLLTAQELETECPLTGQNGKWIRPNLHYDDDAKHVPPPPAEPIPEELKAAPVESDSHVEMEVMDDAHPEGKRKVMARKASGVFTKGAPIKVVQVQVVDVS